MHFVIANSTPLIALAKINELNILKDIYSQIVIPKAVYKEVAILGKGREGSVEITKAKWIKRWFLGRRQYCEYEGVNSSSGRGKEAQAVHECGTERTFARWR